MPKPKCHWIIYTVLVGLLPSITRALAFLFYNNAPSAFMLNESDIIFFGLVLNITSINQIQQFFGNDHQWAITQTGFAILIIVLHGMMLTFSYISNLTPTEINITTLKISSFILCIPSLLISYSIFIKINSPEQ